MKSSKERRRDDRLPVAVLVTCAVKNKDEVFASEMWAKDVSDNGLKLEWRKDDKLPSRPGLEGLRWVEGKKSPFEKGQVVKIHDLFYDDEGAPAVEGRIQWIKSPTDGEEGWSFGVKLASPGKKRQVPAFRDFVSVAKDANKK